MKQFETRFKQVDVLPMVKHFMDELNLFNLFKNMFRQPPIAMRIMRKAYAY